MRYIIVKEDTGEIVNTTELEGENIAWNPLDGCEVFESADGDVGDFYVDGEIIKTPPPPIDPQILITIQRTSALQALEKSDTTILRSAESGVEVPKQWREYRAALRVIISEGGALPERPPFPAGT